MNSSIGVAEGAWNTLGVGPQVFSTLPDIGSGHNFIKPVTTQEMLVITGGAPAMAAVRFCYNGGCNDDATVPVEYLWTETVLNIDPTYPEICFVCPSTTDPQRNWVLTHEFGHVLGLAHHGSCADTPPSLMCGTGVPPGFSFPYPSAIESGSLSDCKMGSPFDDDGIRCIFDWYNCGSDLDCDTVASGSDNCSFAPNQSQKNYDGEILDLSPVFAPDDWTSIDSDGAGDICDPDDDDDGLPTSQELTQKCSGPGSTNPLDDDTDRDFVIDGVECLLGSDPTNAASKPALTPDADGDRLADAYEAMFGTNPGDNDSDDDKMTDGLEVFAYGSNPLSTNSDGAICVDNKEAASFNMDYKVNSGDMGMLVTLLADGSTLYDPADPVTGRAQIDIDSNRDGRHSSGDQGFHAAAYGLC